MALNKSLLISAMVGSDGEACSPAMADKWLQHLNAVLDCYDISTPERVAAFIAQIGHESGNLTVNRENMNYRASLLLQTWPSHFSADPKAFGYVGDYEHKPERIANRAYGGRMGNGDEGSGDGWKYRGGGLMQLTGKDDYRDCGKGIGLDLLGHPELIEDPRAAAMSAGWEWERGKLNALADVGDFDRITRVINGGLIGQPDRLARWHHALSIFKA